jgi:hypothetical protein
MLAKIVNVIHVWSNQPSLGMEVTRSHLGLIRRGGSNTFFESKTLLAVKD